MAIPVPIGWGQQGLLVVICEIRQDHDLDNKNSRSGQAGEMGLGAYDYEEVWPMSKAPWRTSSSAGRCSSSSLGHRPRLVHRGSEGPVGGAPRSQMVRWRRRGKTGGAPISSRSGRRGPAPGGGPQRRPLGLGGGNGNRWAEGNGWPASSWVGAPEYVQHEAAAVGRAERGSRKREIGRRERRRRSRMVCFKSKRRRWVGQTLRSAQNQKAINELTEI
jgi:hypothetical protein